MLRVPQSNIPLFESATARLRELGLDIISPIELDPPETREIALAGGNVYGNESIGTVLGRDIKNIIDGGVSIIVLPNWGRSKGARLEVWTVLDRGGAVHEYNTETKNIGPACNPASIAGILVAKWMPDEIKKAAGIAA